MDELSRTLAAVRQHLQLRWAASERDAAVVQIRRKYGKQRLRRRVLIAGATVAVSASLMWVLSFPPALERTSSPPRVGSQGTDPATGVQADTSAGPMEKVLADGSRWQPLTEASEVVVSRMQPREVSLQVRAGGARFDVVHRAERVFRVQARDVTVSVLGTRFSVELLDGMTRVTVEQGRVQVNWREGEVVLHQQQSRSFPYRRAADLTEDERVANSTQPRKRAVTRSGQVRQPRSWRVLARQGRYSDAYRQLETLEKAGSPAVGDEARDLFLAADSARLSGHPEQAVPYLARIVKRRARDTEAALAAFTLGRLYLEDLGRSADAATAFAEARELGLRKPLAESALAHEAEALWRADRLGRARERTEAYLQQYPRGKYADRLRARLAAPQ